MEWKQTTLGNKLNVIIAAVICAATIVNVAALIIQLSEQDKQVESLTNAITTGIQEAKATAETALKDNRESLSTSMKALHESAQSSLNASIEQSRTALAASIAASQLDQRAWVTVNRIELKEELSEGKEFVVFFYSQNTGQTPAIDYAAGSRLYLLPQEPPVERFGFSDEPAGSHPIIGPSGGIVDGRSRPWTPAATAIRGYVAGINRLYLRAFVSYRDVFGVPHWTAICAFHNYQSPLGEWLSCAEGNRVDANTDPEDPPIPPDMLSDRP
ncbi:MAG: hypothetical protein WD733_24660 [Bryobacterales bacterium]